MCMAGFNFAHTACNHSLAQAQEHCLSASSRQLSAQQSCDKKLHFAELSCNATSLAMIEICQYSALALYRTESFFLSFIAHFYAGIPPTSLDSLPSSSSPANGTIPHYHDFIHEI
eukprot:TRINITY_DN1512_c0_g1_i2.p1 TRINITY_DN1512_c0_g1~~TRINITY_DN1512_c0_g1_i2.p1  ORF type:complete len:115 (-),score=11.48 TRINITY_DN1512_c0_g1_i2:518-862(-)